MQLKKTLGPDEKRELVQYAKHVFGVSVHQNYGLFHLSVTVY